VVAPAVVHTHGYRADVLAAGVARSLGLSTATTVHGFTGGDLKNRMYEWLQRRSYRRYGAVVAVSRPLVELLAGSGVARRRIHLIPNAWSSGAAGLPRDEARRRLGVAEGVFLVGWVGRFGREKGADLLLEALARLRGSGVQAAIIGDGRERRALAVQADRLGLSECVRWHGAVPDAARLFSAFDCFVLSSRTEGTPMVLFEAMAARAPIVAARVGGVPDVVGPREALLVDPESPAALAAAVEQVRTDRADAERRAAAAEARLHTHFALGPWLDGYEAVYEALTHVRPLIRTS
jgi:glycosyltransferase involved in cell wall biosynthesis